MLIKWIHCITQDPISFAKAQAKWKSLQGCNGFLGQFGGFSVENQEDAYIIGIWKDSSSYERFMNVEHDRIFEGSKQAHTYSHLKTLLFEPGFQFNPRNANSSLKLHSGNVVRMAMCNLAAQRREHFDHVQKSIWVPGMSSASGFLDGWFGYLGDELALVLSIWENEKDHEIYRNELFSPLFKEARPNEDCSSIKGAIFKISEEFLVESTICIPQT
jgi:hypothetical protein